MWLGTLSQSHACRSVLFFVLYVRVFFLCQIATAFVFRVSVDRFVGFIAVESSLGILAFL